jgi:hypothetical protein
MINILHRHPAYRVNMALILVALWGSLALAAAVYDIGRWVAAW